MMHAQAQHQAAAPASTCAFFVSVVCVFYTLSLGGSVLSTPSMQRCTRVSVLHAIDAAPFALSASHGLLRSTRHDFHTDNNHGRKHALVPQERSIRPLEALPRRVLGLDGPPLSQCLPFS